MRPQTFFLIVLTAAASAAAEWTQWRGPNRDGVSAAALPATLPKTLVKKWEVPLGAGHSSPLVAAGVAYVMSRGAGETEQVTAHDLASGKTLWKHSYAAPFQINQYATKAGKGPFSTPLLQGGRLYTVSSSSIVTALDAKTGKVLWSKRPFDATTQGNNHCGAAASPLIVDGVMVLHLGDERKARLLGFDPATGAIRWERDYDAPGYASPVVAEFGGVKQVITLTSKRAIAVAPGSGELLWSEPFPDEWMENIVTPVLAGSRIVFAGVRRGAFAVEPRLTGGKWTTKLAWDNPEATMYMSTPVVDGDTLIGFSNKKKGHLLALDSRTGKQAWTAGDGRAGDNAALILAGRRLLALTDDGQLSIYQGGKFEARYAVAQSATWAHPVLVDGGVLVKSFTGLALWTWQ